MFTQRHFIAIADMLSWEFESEKSYTKEDIIKELVHLFKRHNSNFKEERFLKASFRRENK
jgi:hypothetical protein